MVLKPTNGTQTHQWYSNPPMVLKPTNGTQTHQWYSNPPMVLKPTNGTQTHQWYSNLHWSHMNWPYLFTESKQLPSFDIHEKQKLIFGNVNIQVFFIFVLSDGVNRGNFYNTSNLVDQPSNLFLALPITRLSNVLQTSDLLGHRFSHNLTNPVCCCGAGDERKLHYHLRFPLLSRSQKYTSLAMYVKF